MFPTEAISPDVVIQLTLALIALVAIIVAGIVPAILGLLAALIGLYWGVMKFIKWVANDATGFVSWATEKEYWRGRLRGSWHSRDEYWND